MFGDGSHVGTHLRFKSGALAIHGAGSSSMTNTSSHPKRGDTVSFVKANKNDGVRDIRVVARKTATMLRGRLENIEDGKAVFFAANEAEDRFEISLSEVVSCDPSVLKEKESVEGVLENGKIYGVCRTIDLYLESKVAGSALKGRPKLNLAVKKEGVVARAQAKGPDGSEGFIAGWTDRVSKYCILQESVEAADGSQEAADGSQDETEEKAADA